MRGFIAQELALLHPEKVNRLIIYSSGCGGKEAVPSQLTPEQLQSMISGNASKELFLHTLFPQNWIQNNSEYIENEFVYPMGKVSKESLQFQSAATSTWSGSCERLSDITNPTLVIIGTQDITVPPANSLMIAEKIPGAWLVQIKGGGHGLMFQYPQQSTAVLETFLSVT